MLLFAGLRESIGQKEVALELPPEATLGDAVVELERRWPAVAGSRRRLLVSLNAERVPLERPLADGDEVALLPPMSGGSGVHAGTEGALQLLAEPLSLDRLIARVSAPECGGVVTFTGVVRNHARGETIDHLEYEAYEPMARGEMERIRSAVAIRWPGARLAIAHRVGRLEIGDAAVMIVAAGAHRAEAFEACRYAIDTLKETVPIWKKEFAESGAYWVDENP